MYGSAQITIEFAENRIVVFITFGGGDLSTATTIVIIRPIVIEQERYDGETEETLISS